MARTVEREAPTRSSAREYPSKPLPRPLIHVHAPTITPACGLRRRLFRQEPPRLVRRPNLFLIGAMKSGTTSLDRYLGSHPSIYMAPSKEPTHFVSGHELRRVSEPIWRMGYWRDRARYLAEFDGAEGATVLGESSTNYSKLPAISGVAKRIADFNPDARIVYIMRDPIERTLSHYWHNAKHHAERRPPLDAIRTDDAYRDVSDYARQLEPYLTRFGSERVYTLTLEGLREDPRSELRTLYEWLGVDPDHLPTDLSRRNETGHEVAVAHRMPVLRKLRSWRHWDRIRPLIPDGLVGVGRNLAERKTDRRTVDVTEVVAYLRPIQREQAETLSAQLGRSFPEWTTLFGDVDAAPTS